MPTPARDPSGHHPWSTQSQHSACMLFLEGEHHAGRVTTDLGDLRYLNLNGDLLTMGHELGAKMHDSIRRGVLPFLAKGVDAVLTTSPVGRLERAAAKGLARVALKQLRERLPEQVSKSLYKLSDAAGISPKTVIDAHLMPEALLWLQASWLRAGRRPLCLSPLGCSSLITRAHDGRLLVGHNFDYFGINYWERYNTITFYHPTRGLSYAAINSAGMLGAGLMGMNSAGLTIALHQHFVKRIDLSGIPIGIPGDAVLRRATTIEQAIEILRQYPPVAGWSYTIAEADSGRAALFEVAPGAESVQIIDLNEARTFTHTSRYQGQKTRALELDLGAGHARFRDARKRRVDRVARDLSAADKIDIPDLALALADMTQPDDTHQGVVSSLLSQVSTVTGVIFDPSNRRVWVSAGKSPSSRGWFVPFDLEQGEGSPALDLEPFCPTPGWWDEPHGRAFELYRQVCYRYLENEPLDKLFYQLELAVALWAHDPDLHALCALFALKLENPRRARGALELARDLENNRARRAELDLYYAWTLDALGERREARKLYKQITRNSSAPQHARDTARKFRRGRFDHTHAARLAIDPYTASGALT